jgi:hypothetical protein
MEDRSELNFEHVPNQEPSAIQETSTPIQQDNNPLSTSIKPIELFHSIPIYIFLEMLVAYAQNESLKHLTFTF